MHLHPRLLQHLRILTENLPAGTDLEAILGVLFDDLRDAAPSFLGLELTVCVDDAPVTVSTLGAGDAGAVAASLHVPLEAAGVTPAGASVVFYAAAGGAFDAMAAAMFRDRRLGAAVVLDGHLAPVGVPGVAGLDELAAIHQAVGILIARGHPPDDAHAVLAGRAAALGLSKGDVARSIVDGLNG